MVTTSEANRTEECHIGKMKIGIAGAVDTTVEARKVSPVRAGRALRREIIETGRAEYTCRKEEIEGTVDQKGMAEEKARARTGVAEAAWLRTEATCPGVVVEKAMDHHLAQRILALEEKERE